MPVETSVDALNDIYGSYIKVKSKFEDRIDVLTKKYPAIYWARNYHVNTRGEKMTFFKLHYLYHLYKEIENNPKMCVIKAVQCCLSEFFIIQSHIEAGERGLTVMYVLPKYELRNRFVNNRIYKLHKKVKHYAYLVKAAEMNVHRTSLMHFGRGTLAYVGSNVADEFIEIPVDSIYVDELDRCNQENLLMLPDRISASPYGYERDIANPTIEGYGIDEKYQDSSQGTWQIKCNHCNKWFMPDFFKHIVQQVEEHKWIARDKEHNPDDLQSVARLIHDCGKPVDRLRDGEWVHAFQNKLWKGYRINKVFSKFAGMGALVNKWQKAQGNDLKIQLIYNSDLGIAYSAKGAKVTTEMLNDCRREYIWPVRKSAADVVRLMGVDVGTELNVVIRERIKYEGLIILKLILATTVPGFSQLISLIDEWRPKIAVVDAQPEIHKVMDLKDARKMIWSSRFQEGLSDIVLHKKIKEVRMDRTAILDYVKQGYEMQTMWLPMQAEFIDNGNYYDQLRSPTRILEANEANPEKSKYAWRHSKPDHYFLAEAYCIQAGMIMPHSDIWEFYADESEAMTKREAKKEVKDKDAAKREEILRKQKLTPELFLGRMQDRIAKKTKVKPPVDDEAIRDFAKDLLKSQGYADVFLVSNMSKEHEGDVRRVFLTMGLSESRIKGQYIE